MRNGKNWYININDCEITINKYSYTIITAHIIRQNTKETSIDNYSNKGIKKEKTMDRLERFEKALKDILDGYDEMGKELEKLRENGQMKTTKFRELLGKKLVYSMIITIFKRYNLIDKSN